jgi:hypothetical protein
MAMRTKESPMQIKLGKPVTLGILILAMVAVGGGSAFGAALLASKAPTSVLACRTAKGVLALPTKSSCAKGLSVIHLPLSTKVGPRGPAGARGQAGPRGVTGPTGARGVAGPAGPSIAYSNAALSNEVPLPEGPGTMSVTSLNVPAGDYVVVVSVDLIGTPSTSVVASCTLSDDNEGWNASLPDQTGTPFASMSFATPVGESSAATISLLCSATVGEKVEAEATLIATKVGALQLS